MPTVRDDVPSTLHVLALDDNPADLRLLDTYLRKIPGWKGQFRGVSTSAAMKQALAGEKIDLIFLDHWLGEETGLGLIVELRQQGERRPVIALTGQGDERLAARYIQDGADDYLVKDDLNPDMLRRAIEGVFTRRRLEEEKLLLSEELNHARKLESIGQLAGGVAHDFNNLLTCIVGNIDLVLTSSMDDRSRQCLKSAELACSRMAELVRTLMSFSRKDVTQTAPVDLRGLVDEIAVILRHTLDRMIQIECALSPEPMVVEGNASMIQQIVMNLALNGAESMAGSGSLTLRAYPEPDPAGDVNGGGVRHAVIEVTDEGPGIAPAMLERIFEPYFTTKQRSSVKGGGLGLAIVRQNVMRHHGTVRVESVEGKGSSFIVRLPLSPTAASYAARFRPPELARGSGTILVVDDEDMVRQVAAALLAELGYHCLCVEDGVEALKLLGEGAKSLTGVILDISMPRMSGEECLTEIRRAWPELPVLIATGHEDPALDARVRAQGAGDVLLKPFKLDRLSVALQRVLLSRSNAPAPSGARSATGGAAPGGEKR